MMRYGINNATPLIAILAVVTGCGGHQETSARLQLRLSVNGSGSDIQLTCRPDKAEGLANPAGACRALPALDLTTWHDTVGCAASHYSAIISGTYGHATIRVHRCDRRAVRQLVHALGWTPPVPG